MKKLMQISLLVVGLSMAGLLYAETTQLYTSEPTVIEQGAGNLPCNEYLGSSHAGNPDSVE